MKIFCFFLASVSDLYHTFASVATLRKLKIEEDVYENKTAGVLPVSAIFICYTFM